MFRPFPPSEETSASCRFNTTHWSVVLSAQSAQSAQSPQASESLAKLCRIYWWPLYAFVRRRGYAAHDAQDLTQEFFARLLANDFLRPVDRSKGRFRSFLLAALQHFLAKEWRRAHTQKRGGEFTFVSINDETAEQPYLQVAASNQSPDRIFDQQWALTLLNQAVARLGEEFVAAGKGPLFQEIKIFLTGEKQTGRYAELALKLQTSESALKMAVSRMRQRYGELLRAEIANTVSGPEEVEEEWRALLAALNG